MHFAILLLLLSSSVLGYDIFQGILKLPGPCFPATSHEKCNRTLLESYEPPFRQNTLNRPDTSFFLFTPSHPDTAELLHKCGGELPFEFDVSCPTEVFVHGWLDGVCRTAWMREMKQQLYLRSNCFNVILVDWTWGNTIDLNLAKFNARVVGAQVAFVLKNILKKKKYESKKIHIIGHSYGAYAAGYTAGFMKGKLKLGRITAMDYAFVYRTPPVDPIDILTPDDAHFVDAIHSNGGRCMPVFIGDSQTLGHVDFFMNGGTINPSCVPYAVTSFFKLDLFYAIASFFPNICSHVQAIQFYKVSINALQHNDSQLIGIKCGSKEEFLSGNCSRNCDVGKAHCMVAGMDTPLYFDKSDGIGRSYYVPVALTCPYVDHSGFTGLPLKRINKEGP